MKWVTVMSEPDWIYEGEEEKLHSSVPFLLRSAQSLAEHEHQELNLDLLAKALM